MLLRKIPALFLPLLLAFAAPDCRLDAQQAIPRILQGQETDDFPSVGIVGSLRNGGFCTGTLITPTDVLTAAHCAIVIDGPQQGTFELDGQIYRTAEIAIHPGFNNFTLGNDIAILRLNEAVLDVPPSAIFRDEPLVGDVLSIVGYGSSGTAQDGADGTFGTKRVGITTIDEVTAQLVSWFYDDANESNTAAGDSGGPGYIDIDGDLFVACITSGGTEPDSVLGDFAFNTRVDAYADWIDSTIAELDDQASQDDPAPPGTPDPTPGSEDFWSQPFPILQWLISFLTQLLEHLTQATGDGIEAVEVPGPSPGPSETGEQETDQTPGVAEVPQDETPAECPVQNPTDPVSEEPVVEQVPTNPAPIEIPTEPIVPPPVDQQPVVPGELPTDPADVAGQLPIGVGGGGGQPGIDGGSQPGGSRTRDTTSASVLAAWNRAMRLIAPATLGR
jgi:hypothetical protein